MSNSEFKSGPKVVIDFLEAKVTNKAIDAEILKVVRSLFETKKLSKAQLLRALEAQRDGLTS